MNWRISPIRAIGLLAFLGVNIWLLGFVAIEVMSDNRTLSDKVDWNHGLSASVAKAGSRKPIETYAHILAQPVFFRSRQPFVPAPSAPLPVSLPAPPTVVIDPGLTLGGVMIKGGVKKAYVFNKAGTSGTWTSEGDDFMGWRVGSISGTGAKLEQKGRSIDLLLYPQQ